jgi:hypothetical protein
VEIQKTTSRCAGSAQLEWCSEGPGNWRDWSPLWADWQRHSGLID